jgi:hypothetical protein
VQGVVVPKLEPVAVPVIAKATVPAGVDTAPALVAGSTTVAVQVDVALKVTVDGLHETVVLVGRRLTVSVDEALPVPALFVAETVTPKMPA